ncbi:hypothetical protein TRP8649_03638 [Pelagimonas phthalicica]|uniref:Thoeris protein ThsB TIR-like domain-containing protein n=1 Tax=Pelagimonas phthalicica TaxID=1037362 RepID=A0A238JHS1_9RHOB|nr:TIR domain-containing protein [Pelagimonas phthalicica]TDS92439.1 TIR-like protein DUF1863 [Pelagimonas phthalicica]SMX29502.1 hypothetical protein TRP8649_03638 [Pelagimonas phthalicica]
MRYRIFISHAWAYRETYWSIRAMLDKATATYSDFDYVDYSIPDHNPILSTKGALLTGPRLLAKAIQTRIDQSSVVLVPARMFVNHSDWVLKEIDYAIAKRYRVIALRSRSTLRVPTGLIQRVGSSIDANYRSLYAAITS